MSNTTKIMIGVGVVAAVGVGVWFLYKRNPGLFSRPQNPQQVNPAVGATPTAKDKTAQRIEAGSKALDSVVGLGKGIGSLF